MNYPNLFLKTLLFLSLLPAQLIKVEASERLVIGVEAGKGLTIVDPAADNRPLWNYPVGSVHDLHLLPNGNFLTQDGWTRLIEINLAKEVVWEYDVSKENRASEDGKVEVHAYQRYPDGSTLIVESGAARMIEVTPLKTITRVVPLSIDSPNPHSDTRLARRLDNGHYLVAHEADEAVREYDPTGQVVWEFAIPLFDQAPAKGHGPEAYGGKCFAAIRARNGNTLITTGNGHSILEVTPEKEIVWRLSQHELPGITLAWLTTIEELPNGNLRFGNCHAGPGQPQIIEINKEKELIWTFQDFSNFGNNLANTLVLDGDEAKALRGKLSQQ